VDRIIPKTTPNWSVNENSDPKVPLCSGNDISYSKEVLFGPDAAPIKLPNQKKLANKMKLEIVESITEKAIKKKIA
jgi:hypothetical protein